MGEADSALTYANRIIDLARSYRIPEGEAEGLFAQAQVYADIQRSDSVLILALAAGKMCAISGCWFRNQLIALVAPLFFLGADTLQRDSLISLLRGYASLAKVQSDTVGLARLYDAMGQVFTERFQQYDSALAYYRKAIDLKQVDRETIYGMGRAFRGLGVPDSSWLYFTILLNMSRQFGDLRAEGYALANMGGVCHRDVKPPKLGCALAYYDSAASVASQILRQAGQDMNRVIYGEQASQIYAEWPFAWLSASDAIGKQSADIAAFFVAELGRSEALRDLMAHSHTRDRIPPLGNSASALGQQLVNLLPAGIATLSYHVQADTLLVWLTLPNHDVKVYRWAIPYDSLRAYVSDFRSAIGADDEVAGSRLRGLASGSHVGRRRDLHDLTLSAARLARTILPKDLPSLLPAGGDLVLVPQNILNLVPFDILPIEGAEATLGERYAIRYSPSLVSLISVESAERAAPPVSTRLLRALVVSDPTMPTAEFDGVRIRLSQLPAADSEGKWVAGRLRAKWLRGSEATEARVLSEMREAEIVHFATHAVAYAFYTKARDSFLALAPDSTHDGLLTVGKLMDDTSLAMPARLVVLSACQSALGSVMQAEGTVGLQRAFFAKGARAVLVSLWSVDDEATELLMQRFYDHWLADSDSPTKAEALRRAQADVRKTARFSHPLFWAAFELVGAN